ncbi:myelin expression factor 2-like [Diorhabda carinulata]|uniref:myelin expression factor 2-like n=1 Tax=Diorhabda carinulata TaxID=1163345 RepID=UPI0025A0D7A5|nr:myelin expression factor 2-like [Diorhabda carinulata]
MSESSNDQRGRERDRPRRERNNSRMDNSRDRSNDRGGGGREPRSMRSSQNRVYVSNIPYEYRWQDIKDLFRSRVGDVAFVELFVDDNDKPKGSGIVEFSDGDAVRKCLEIMQRFEVKGRKLVVKDDGGVTRDKSGAIISSGGRRNRDSDRFRDDRRDLGSSLSLRNDDKWGNTYGLSPQFLESLKIDPPLNNKVFVANLDYNIDQKKLKEVFKLAGRVINVDLPLDKDGKVRGFAVIEYDHPVEAVQAISMLQGQVLNDRTLAVRMDRVNEHMKLPEGLRSIGMGLGPNGEPLKNVAHNLPSLNTNSQIGGSGILGAVPNNSLQLANALSGLGNLGNSQVFQSGNLSGFASTLLGNGLGATDLSSLVQNPLAQNTATPQLAALAQQNTASGNIGTFRGSNSGNDSFGNQNSNYNNLSGGRNFQGAGGGFNNNDQLSFNNGARSGGMDRQLGGGKSFSRKVLISNLPPMASYKLLSEKFSEFGEVQGFEEKSHGSILITYGSDWQAERAIKNLDKARIDGRMIDARLYY